MRSDQSARLPDAGSSETGLCNIESDDLGLQDFIAGPENRLLITVSETLGTGSGYNPILLYGATGLGKSHLLGLLTRIFLTGNPDAHILSVNGAEFARSQAAAIELNTTVELRAKQRSLDLLVLDDLDELAGRTYAQQELLYTIDVLGERQAQILLASRVNPAEADWMIASLSSRLCGGLTVPLSKPSPPTQRALLLQLAAEQDLSLSDAVCDRIVGDPETESFTQLAAVVARLVQRNETSPDDKTTKLVLESHRSQATVSPRKIVNQVARYFRIKSTELVGSSRSRSTVRARGAAIYLVRRITGISFEQLGAHFGGRDHSTVLHAYRRTEQALDSDPLICKAIQEVSRRLGTTL